MKRVFRRQCYSDINNSDTLFFYCLHTNIKSNVIGHKDRPNVQYFHYDTRLAFSKKAKSKKTKLNIQVL